MSAIADTPELLTTSEVARLMRVRPRTVRRWIKGGVLPAKQIGAHYRIPVDALNVPPRHMTTRSGGP